MNKFKIFITLNIILMLCSFGTVKEGFTNQKKNSIDEFLVEKKSPLIMPPNFDELPNPSGSTLADDSKNNSIKNLISKPRKDNTNLKNINKSIENSVLEKIKSN